VVVVALLVVVGDDELNEMLVRPMLVRPIQRGVKLHAVVDACHGGTGGGYGKLLRSFFISLILLALWPWASLFSLC
jgi:hypothetical protein